MSDGVAVGVGVAVGCSVAVVVGVGVVLRVAVDVNVDVGDAENVGVVVGVGVSWVSELHAAAPIKMAASRIVVRGIRPRLTPTSWRPASSPATSECVDKLQAVLRDGPRRRGLLSTNGQMFNEIKPASVRPEEPPSSGNVSKGGSARKSTHSSRRERGARRRSALAARVMHGSVRVGTERSCQGFRSADSPCPAFSPKTRIGPRLGRRWTAKSARDLWAQIDHQLTEGLGAEVPAHAVAMYRVRAVSVGLVSRGREPVQSFPNTASIILQHDGGSIDQPTVT